MSIPDLLLIGSSLTLLVLVCAALRGSGPSARSANNSQPQKSTNISYAWLAMCLASCPLVACDVVERAEVVQVTNSAGGYSLVARAAPGQRVALLYYGDAQDPDVEPGGIPDVQCTFVPMDGVPWYADVYDPGRGQHVMSIPYEAVNGSYSVELPEALGAVYSYLEVHFPLNPGDCFLGFRLDGQSVGYSLCQSRPCTRGESIDYGLGIARDSFFGPATHAPVLLINGIVQ